MNPDRSRRAAPKAGLVIVATALVLGAVLFAATRAPSPPPTDMAAAPTRPTGGQAPAPPTGDHVSEAPPSPGAKAPTPATDGKPGRPAPAVPTPSAMPAPAPTPPVRPEELPPDHPVVNADPSTQVSIQWLGHSCFYIHSPGGVTVVTDPFDPKATGLPAPSMGAHLITISADDPRHNNRQAIHAFQGETQTVVRGTEARQGDLQILPVSTYRDPAGGSREGRNTAYVIQAGPMRIVHLGDLGHTLNPAQVKALGAVDILMVPVGGDGLSPKDAVTVAKQVNPKIVIPMAYSTSSMSGADARLRPVDDFIAASPYARTEKEADVMILSKSELPASTEIYTLRYGR